MRTKNYTDCQHCCHCTTQIGLWMQQCSHTEQVLSNFDQDIRAHSDKLKERRIFHARTLQGTSDESSHRQSTPDHSGTDQSPSNFRELSSLMDKASD